MKHNTVTIRTSRINKWMIENQVCKDFNEDNPDIENPSVNMLITYMLKQHFRLHYGNKRSEAENGLNKPND